MELVETHLEKELDDLKLKVLEMTALTEKALDKSYKALFERNSELAEEVIEEDVVINEQQYALDEAVLKLLALGRPMARDLRFVIGSSTFAMNLERIGDQATNICESVMFLNQREPLPRNPLVEDLARTVREMLETAVTAFRQRDFALAQEVCRMDSRADALNLKVLKHYVKYMIDESRSVDRAINMVIVARALERIGDLATNLAEQVIFIYKGEDVRGNNCHPY